MHNLAGQGMIDTIDVMDDTGEYMAVIRGNLEYDHHMKFVSTQASIT